MKLTKYEKINNHTELVASPVNLELLLNYYLNRIDDYYEAENAFINDLNKIFKKKGSVGVISADILRTLEDVITERKKELRNYKL
jgi:hypothetical protein